MKKFYVTTAIPYVNASPHIGFAMEITQADTLARYHRMKGEEVYFLTGVDEHGVKLYETAKAAGKDTQAFADEYAVQFRALKGILGLSNDGFIRTTDSNHKKAAQKLWSVLVKKGDIYKGSYKGNYCSGCEAYILDKDLVDGKCPMHNKAPTVIEEENYFFKLSKYSDAIKKAIETDELRVLPASRKHEMLNLIGDEGLKDVSFSRPKNILPWGIDVPDDPTQVMYVWCDALANYVTALGYDGEVGGGSSGDADGSGGKLAGAAGGVGAVDGKSAGGVGGKSSLLDKFWPCDAHVIGKDILRFHAGIWIGMLMSAGLSLPKSIFVHGFVTSDGKKMSKSIGNVVDPILYVNEFGNEPLRYYLIREIPTGDDGDFSRSRFIEIYNSELANSFGNLVNRVVMMAEKNFSGVLPSDFEDEKLNAEIGKFWTAYEGGMNDFNMKISMEAAIGLMMFGNKYVDDNKPWELAKKDPEALVKVLYDLLEILRNLALMMAPIMPEKSLRVLKMLGISDVLEAGYGKFYGFLKKGSKIAKEGESLFPRIEVK